MRVFVCRKRFGSLMEIRGDNYANVIDNCPSSVTLIIHIYNEVSEGAWPRDSVTLYYISCIAAALQRLCPHESVPD